MELKKAVQIANIKRIENLEKYENSESIYKWLKELEFYREWWNKYKEAYLNSEFPRAKAHWESHINKDYEEWLSCSSCGFETGRLNYFKYCPNCGAYMGDNK